MADFLSLALAQLFVIVRHEQFAKCCFCIGYKKYDLKTTEVMASGTKQNTKIFEV